MIALYAHRVPLSANYPEPIEATADIAVACVQLVLGVLLAPALLTEIRSVLIAWVSAMPMLVLGTVLAGRPIEVALLPGIVVGLWLLTYWLGQKPNWRLILVLLTVVGPVFRYLYADFSPHLPPPDTLWAASAPLGLSILLHSGDFFPVTILWPIGMSALIISEGLLTSILSRRTR